MRGAADLRAFCRPPGGVPVVFNGTSTYTDGQLVCGLFDRPVQIQLAGEGIGGGEVAHPTLHLPYNAFNPMPSARDTVTVDGVDYTVYPPTTEDDGAFLCYDLKAK